MRSYAILVSLCSLLLSGSHNNSSEEQTATKTENYLDVENSHVYFETFGNSENKALILIHGNAADLTSMYAQVDFLRMNSS